MPHVLFYSQHPAGHETPISLQLAYSTYFVLCASVWENKERQKILSVCVCARVFVLPLSIPCFWHCSGHKATLLLQSTAASEWAITLKHPR